MLPRAKTLCSKCSADDIVPAGKADDCYRLLLILVIDSRFGL